MPDELKNLTWIEELLIARAHVVGRFVRLQARNQAPRFAVKGHVIFLPQNNLELRDLSVNCKSSNLKRTLVDSSAESYLKSMIV